MSFQYDPNARDFDKLSRLRLRLDQRRDTCDMNGMGTERRAFSLVSCVTV